MTNEEHKEIKDASSDQHTSINQLCLQASLDAARGKKKEEEPPPVVEPAEVSVETLYTRAMESIKSLSDCDCNNATRSLRVLALQATQALHQSGEEN